MHSEWLGRVRAKVGNDLLLLPGVGALVRDRQGRLLLQLRTEDGLWSLPGGAIEPGETPAQAVVREVREETGLAVRPRRLAGVVGGLRMRTTYPNGDQVEYTALVFDCEPVGGQLSDEDPETSRLQWFHVEDMPPLSAPIPPEVLKSSGPAWFEA